MFHLPIAIIGLLIVGLGNCMPETFFTLRAAQKGDSWMVIGDLMGGVIMCATLVLGVVSLIKPIIITNFSPFAAARVFMIISALFFLFSVRTGQKITKREGTILVFIYVFYLLAEILIRYISL
jgi:cation:H+ antiporter